MFSDVVFDAFGNITESIQYAIEDASVYDRVAVLQMLTSMLYVIALSDSLDSAGKRSISKAKLKEMSKNEANEIYNEANKIYREAIESSHRKRRSRPVKKRKKTTVV